MYKLITLIWLFISLQANAGFLITEFGRDVEGYHGGIFSNNGITFSNFDGYIDQRLQPGFYIDTYDLDGASGDFPPFNLLTFGSYTPGVDVNYGRFGSADIDFDAPLGDEVYLYFYGSESPDNAIGNILTLEALFDDAVVASDSVKVEYQEPGLELQSLHIPIGTPFNRLRLVASEPDSNQGPVFLGIQEVVIYTLPETVPEPGTLMLFSMLILAVGSRRSVKT
ncbi:PEP-CTERM sorting domain-containing protein [Thalassomonas haliotis]|uniref:PEP-CTERM sorting domain-containing protein n=1 Tax=Thalassomonas haliotis TaxID=485448 RepID=A0ABY7VCX8_9GAMM|nr:PEP-CTERM sorting domain-containing protein [Thalassomonas haliotis]WDE11538.1 PEP-CTERM sorting domain-containing protein [Thalassomonas haliotis]